MNTPTIDGPRACSKAELPEVIALVDPAMGRDGTGQTVRTDYPLVYEDGNLENIRILKVDGELVSVVPFLVWPVEMAECRFRVGNISPTATAQHHRMKGYGRRCLRDCCRRMEAMGCEMSLLRTDVATFPFYECEDYLGVRNHAWTYRCTREDAERFTPHGEEVGERMPPTSCQLAAVRAMHDGEITGIRRLPEQYRMLLSLPKMRTLLAFRRETPAAYLVVSRAVNMPGLLEAGGDEAAVETLVHHTLLELKAGESVEAHADLTPSVFGNLLQSRLAERRQPTKEHRMLRINLPSAFFRAIAPWLERENRGVEKSFSVATAGETIGFHFTRQGLKLGPDRLNPHFELTRRQLVAAVFGPHAAYPPERDARLDDLPRFYFPVWMLDRS